MTTKSLLLVLATSGVAHADPRIDVYSPSLEPIATWSLGPVKFHRIIDLSFAVEPTNAATGAGGVLLVSRSNLSGGTGPEGVTRFDTTSLSATSTLALPVIGGAAADPATGTTWIASGQWPSMRVRRYSALGALLATGANFGDDNHTDVLRTPAGRVYVANWDALHEISPSTSTMASLRSVTAPGTFLLSPTWNPATSTIWALTQPNGGAGFQLRSFSPTLVAQSVIDITSGVGDSYPTAMAVAANGDLWVPATHTQAGATVHSVFRFTAAGAALSPTAITVARRDITAATTDSFGNLYVASSGPEPLPGLTAVATSAVAGAATSITFTFVTPSAIEPDDLIRVRLANAYDVSGLTAGSASAVSGLDGTVSWVPVPWAFGGPDPDGPRYVVFERSGGSTVPVGTTVAVRIDGVVNPAVGGSYPLEHVAVYDNQFGNYLAHAEASGGLPSLVVGAAGPADSDGDGVPDATDNCPGLANATQVDANSDGWGDACVAVSAAVARSVVLGEDSTVASGAVVQGGVVLGDRVSVGAGASLAAKAQVSDDSTVGPNAVIGRRTTALADNVFGARVFVAAEVRIGSGNTILDDAKVGYGAVVGDDCVVGLRSVVANLANLGDRCVVGADASVGRAATLGPDSTLSDTTQLGAASSLGARSSLGLGCKVQSNATIASDVAVGPHCVIGRGATIGAGATLGSNVVMRQGAMVPAGVNVPPDTVIGRNVTFTP
jgi:UDP-3-O-[3-hydroxymyristoyl] glucosamine N-acyltransferase